MENALRGFFYAQNYEYTVRCPTVFFAPTVRLPATIDTLHKIVTERGNRMDKTGL
jgi:hypothetical protein